VATPVRMPDIGTVESEVKFVRWLKKEGEEVILGEPLFEVETDKGVNQVESAIAGVLVRCVAAEESRVAVGEAIAYIRKPGDDDAAPDPSPIAATAAGSRRIAPALRALAAKLSVDIDALAARKPDLTREDILAAVREHASAPAPATPRPSGDAVKALPRNQAIVARRVAQSHREKPVYRVHAIVDMSRVIAFREQEGASAPSHDAILCKAAARAVTEQPLFRQYMEGETLMEHPAADIAVALGIGDELYAPAVRDADSASVGDVSRAIQDLVGKAKGHGLGARETEGSCMLVSNLGMFPIESFDAIIHPEHSAALTIGATLRTPVADGDGVRIAPLARLTLAVDHRIINGKAAARFISRVKEIMETGAFA
jgi:pyruvate dehydrogenase E2 component (dihydrolipoamide acetyltransferase)